MKECVMNVGETEFARREVTASRARCEYALELLLRHRENPSVEVERVLADPNGS
jgi:hypothetical protein